MQTVSELRQIIAEKIDGLVMPCHDEAGHHYKYLVTGETYDSVTTKSGILEAPHLKKWAARMGVEYILERRYSVAVENLDQLKDAAILAHQDYFEDAGEVGTAGHEVVERYLKQWLDTGERPQDIRDFINGTDHRLWAIARSAELFMKDFDAEPVASELLVASGKHKLAGTLDALLFLKRPTKWGKGVCEQHIYMCTSTSKQTYTCHTCGQEAVRELTLTDWKTSNAINKIEYAMQVSAYWQGLADMAGIKPKSIVIVRLDKKKATYDVVRVQNRAAAFKAYKNTCLVYDWMKDKQSYPFTDIIPKQRIQL